MHLTSKKCSYRSGVVSVVLTAKVRIDFKMKIKSCGVVVSKHQNGRWRQQSQWKGKTFRAHIQRSDRAFQHFSERRSRMRGLIYCKQCHIQWARDFSGSINIGWVFVHAISTGSSGRPEYLRGIFFFKTYNICNVKLGCSTRCCVLQMS